MEEAQPAGSGEALPPRPQPPRDSDCCRSDCPMCVFNLYERELERWQERVAEIERRRAGAKSSAAPDATGAGAAQPGCSQPAIRS